MTATSLSWLQTKDGVRGAFSVVFEGVNGIWTTTDATSAISTAYAGTNWASSTVHSGMDVVGQMSQACELFAPSIKPSNLTIRILDTDDALIAKFFAASSSTMNITPLQADVSANATSAISALSVGGFASSGDVFIGNETIGHTGVIGNTFTTITRGKYAVWKTDSSGVSGTVNFSYAHKLNPNEVAATKTIGPKITDAPRNSYNRGVSIYFHHVEYDASGAAVYATVNDGKALLIWTGRVKEMDDDGQGRIEFQCTSIDELLQTTIMSRQWSAKLAEGMWLDASMTDLILYEHTNTGIAAPTTKITNIQTIAGAGSMIAWGTLVANIKAAMATGQTDVSGGGALDWSWTVDAAGTGYNQHVSATNTSAVGTTTYLLSIAMHPNVWMLLGFDVSKGHRILDSNDRELMWFTLDYFSTTKRDLRADDAPIRWGGQFAKVVPGIGTGTAIKLGVDSTTTQGTYVSQPTMPAAMPKSATGFVNLGGQGIWAVSLSGATLSLWKDVTQIFAPFGFAPEGAPGVVRMGDATAPPTIKQVWLETSTTPGTSLLKLILSTGTSSYNHTLDVYGWGFGCAVPASQVDLNSFLALDVPSATFVLLMTEPTPFKDVLEAVLSTADKYLVMKNGAITASGMDPGTTGVAGAYALNENNKAEKAERVALKISADSVINRAMIQVNRSIDDKYGLTVAIEDDESISDFGQRRTVTIKARHIYANSPLFSGDSLQSWMNSLLSAIANYSRPVGRFSRTFDYSLIDLAPGDVVALTDNYVVDQTRGTRGVTNMPGRVLSSSFDWTTGRGKVEFIFLPEGLSKVAAWAPSALVDDTQANAGYDAGAHTLTCYSQTYSLSSGTADAQQFVANDKIRVVEKSPTNPASPNVLTGTVSSVAGNVITLTGALTGAWDSTKKYNVEYDVATTVTASQLGYVFVSDGDTTGKAAHDYYKWGGKPTAIATQTASYSSFSRYNNVEGTKGHPLSVWKYFELTNDLNNLLGSKLNQILLNEMLDTAITQSGTTPKLAFGPVWIPCYKGARTLNVQLYGKVDTGGKKVYYDVYAASLPVTGSSETATSYDSTAVKTTVSSSATALAYTTEAAVTFIAVDSPGNIPGFWLTVEVSADAGAIGTFSGITLRETALT